jgi:hypothetical protein
MVKKPHWSLEEIELLKHYYETEDPSLLETLIPNRTYDSIMHKAERLRLRRVKVVHYLEPSTIQVLTEKQAAYLAGLIDGEGTITIAFRYGDGKKHVTPNMFPLILISNTNKALIDYARNLVQGSTLKQGNGISRNRKLVYQIQIAKLLDVENLLTQLLPYLIAKRRQAELALEYCHVRKEDTMLSYNPRLFEIAEEVRALNR